MRDAAFSLIELIAVIVMTAVLAAVAVPTFNQLADTRAAAAAKQLLRDLSFARQRAVATGTTSWVVFDAGAETWSVLAEDPDNPGRANASIITDPPTGQTFVQTLGTGAFQGVEIVSADFDGDAEVGFDWLGQPLNATGGALAASGSATLSGTHGVSVVATTGYVSYVAP